MWYECINKEHKMKVVFSYKQTKDKKGKVIIPACPACRSKKYVSRIKRQTKKKTK